MWTIEKANRAGAVFDAAIVGLVLALGVAELRGGRAAAGATLIVVAGVIAALSWWRPRAEGTVLAVGRANDERQAGVQLRTWALVGQVYMIGFMVLAAATALGGGDGGMWLLLVAVGGVVGLVATVVLRRRM
ncbi:MAG TPA: hypothetical protein VK891_02220 [Euzebyales bacterium]|nr:hypothetical protein [Euzebyales bacterium]